MPNKFPKRPCVWKGLFFLRRNSTGKNHKNIYKSHKNWLRSAIVLCSADFFIFVPRFVFLGRGDFTECNGRRSFVQIYHRKIEHYRFPRLREIFQGSILPVLTIICLIIMEQLDLNQIMNYLHLFGF